MITKDKDHVACLEDSQSKKTKKLRSSLMKENLLDQTSVKAICKLLTSKDKLIISEETIDKLLPRR